MAWSEKLPSGKYRGVYRDSFGKRRSAGTFPHKAQALREAGTKEAEVRRSLIRDADAHKQTWGQWCRTWWPTRDVEPGTLKRDESRRDYRLMPKWENVPIGQITRYSVKQWIGELRAGDDERKPLANSSIQRCVHLFSASLTAAVDAEILTTNPAAKIKLPPASIGNERFLEVEEFNGFARQLPTRQDWIQAQFLVMTGPRIGEAFGLHEHRLDLKRRKVTVIETFDELVGDMKPYPKGKRRRDLPIAPWLCDELEWLLAQRRKTGNAGCGIPHRDGKPCRHALVFQTPEGTVMRRSNWDNVVRLAASMATWTNDDGDEQDVEPFSIHDLRHTYASWLLQSGKVDLAELQELMGHGSIVTTMRYAHLRPDRHAGVTDALPDAPAPFLPHAEPISLEGYRRRVRSDTVGPVGLEPTTHGLKVRCSNQLS